MTDSLQRRRDVLIYLCLTLATLAVYWPVRHQEFVNYDDNYFLTSNSYVQKGITWPNIVWAFSDTSHGWWHPLTWLSHMVDWQLFDSNAGTHKLVSVAFHIGSTLLLFLVLKRMTAAPWRSAFVAAAFALHPLRVESVAWVSERKDVLSTFFWMLSMWAYVRYVENRTARCYLLVVICFTLGLMAKSMLVTLPFVLLLLDVWPLKRIQFGQPNEMRLRFLHLAREKLPLFILSGSFCVVTYCVQASTRVRAVKSIPLFLGVENAGVSYLRYIGKLLWPTNLAVFYPHPGRWPLSQVALATMVVVGITVLVIRTMRVHPYLAVGWFWFLGTLVPVVGLIQAGDQAIADRYTYIPSIGLFLMIAWGLPELLPQTHQTQAALRVAAGGAIAAMILVTSHQLQFWQNSVLLFERALAVTSGNYVAHNNLGMALLQRGRVDEAAQHFQQALEVWPSFPEANKNLADVLARKGQLEAAVGHYEQAIKMRPNWPDAENNLGFALAQQGQLSEAVTHFTKVLQLQPNSITAHVNLGVAYMKLGNLDLALTHFSQAIALNPADAQTHYLMGLVLKDRGRPADASQHFEEALRLKPDYAEARAALDKLRE